MDAVTFNFTNAITTNKSFHPPEPPDDMLSLVACIALERLAVDCSVDDNLRRDARISQYCFTNLDWNDVRDNAHICYIVHFALRKWEEYGFLNIPPHQRGDIRSMMGDITRWLQNFELINI